MSNDVIKVLYEDNHLLAVDKPAGIVTVGLEHGQVTMARAAADYLKRKYQKPGNVYVGVVSRIDRLVSGVLLLARTSKAAARLSEQIRAKSPTKRYLAIVDGRVREPTNEWQTLRNYVLKNESKQRMEVVSSSTSGAKQAVLRWRPLATSAFGTLVEVDLQTGRKHQIRLQLAELGFPVLGDQKYGSGRQFPRGIALHCYMLTIAHPTRREPYTFASDVRSHWTGIPKALLDCIPTYESCIPG